jgi:DNA-binding MarR family transcriptional regulator
MKRKLTNCGRILQTLDRSFGLTRAELANRLGESRDSIRKTLHVMLKDERIARVIGDDGVEIYNITEAGKAALTKELARSSLEEPMPKVWKENTSVIKPAWETLIVEAEQRGFAKGYTEGAKAMQRAAYEDGRQAVVNKLLGLLS